MNIPANCDRRATPLLAEAARLNQNADMVPPSALLCVAAELVGLALARGNPAVVHGWAMAQLARATEAAETELAALPAATRKPEEY